jgi:hypothetical protein
LFFSVHTVHPHEHFGPVLAFGTPGAGVDLHDTGQLVLGLVEGTFELGLVDDLEGPVIGLPDFGFGPLAFFPEVEKDREVFYGGFYVLVEFYPVLVQLDVFEDLGGAFVVVPESGGQGQLFVPGDLFPAVRDVKDTSPGRPGGPSYLLSALVS